MTSRCGKISHNTYAVAACPHVDWYVFEELLVSKVVQVVIYKSVLNEEKITKYAALAGPEVMAAGGRILARNMPVAVNKKAGEATRTVVIESDSLQVAEEGYASDGYQAALTALDGGAIREFRYIEFF